MRERERVRERERERLEWKAGIEECVCMLLLWVCTLLGVHS